METANKIRISITRLIDIFFLFFTVTFIAVTLIVVIAMLLCEASRKLLDLAERTIRPK